MKHFKLTTTTKVNIFGVTLYQLELIIDCKWGKKGDKGGWVESENLSNGDARVSGDARVYGDAQVYGNGLVIWFSHVGSENGTLTVYNTKDNSIEVTRGCFRGSIDEFLAASESKHDETTQLEYRMLIEVAYSRITRAQTTKE